MPDSAIRPGEPFTAEETERLISRFRREGYCDLGAVLELQEVEALREDMQGKWDDAAMHEPERDQIRGRSLMRMFEYSAAFRDLIVREPFASLRNAPYTGCTSFSYLQGIPLDAGCAPAPYQSE